MRVAVNRIWFVPVMCGDKFKLADGKLKVSYAVIRAWNPPWKNDGNDLNVDDKQKLPLPSLNDMLS